MMIVMRQEAYNRVASGVNAWGWTGRAVRHQPRCGRRSARQPGVEPLDQRRPALAPEQRVVAQRRLEVLLRRRQVARHVDFCMRMIAQDRKSTRLNSSH